MTEHGTSPPGTASEPHRAGPIRMLRRSSTNRKVAGVCGGLGAYTNVDPLIYRVLFAVFSLFGGFGLLLYGAAWLIIPEEGQDRSEGQRLLQGHGASTGAAWAVGATVLGFLLFLTIASEQWTVVLWVIMIAAIAYFIVRSRYPAQSDHVEAWWQSQAGQRATPPAAGPMGEAPGTPAAAGSAGHATADSTLAGSPAAVTPPLPPVPPPPKEPPSATGWLAVSAALLVAGVLVSLDVADVVSVPLAVVLACVLVVIGLGLVAAAWYGRARSLILLGIVVMVALALVAALGPTFRGRIGELEVTPATASDLKDTPYEVAMGSMIIDLRQLDPVVGAVIEADMGLGTLEVIYPDDVRLEATADVHVGTIETHNADDARVNGDSVIIDPSEPSRGTIYLDLEVGMGDIEFREGSRR